MNRPKKVREVYRELRHALDDRVPSHQVLKSAAVLVDIFDDRDDASVIRLDEARATFDELPLDKAFADGGWRVMKRESNWVRPLFSEEPQELIVKNRLRSLGMELAA